MFPFVEDILVDHRFYSYGLHSLKTHSRIRNRGLRLCKDCQDYGFIFNIFKPLNNLWHNKIQKVSGLLHVNVIIGPAGPSNQYRTLSLTWSTTTSMIQNMYLLT